MKKIPPAFLRMAAVMTAVVLGVGSLGLSNLRADSDLKNPINPNAPTPNAGVAPGHRAAGDFTARRPGNLPKGKPTHSFTGVTDQTP
jgi:hypothetical protein